MTQDLLRDGVEEGRFFRGNLHCHSNNSDGLLEPQDVVSAYREAGYDFLCLSDHFEERYGWQLTDTRSLRDETFATILGAELSSAPWEDRYCYWVTAAGLPPDFEAPPAEDHAEAIRRAREVGAFVIMLHPALNNLPLAVAESSPGLDAVQAVEIYNHNLASALPAQASGAYMLDGLLERGYRLLVNAGDDAHFGHPRDRFGGWVEVYCEYLDPEALLNSMKAGRYYSTQGPELRELLVDGERLRVETSEAYAISLSGGGDRWQSGQERHAGADGEPIVEAEFDLNPFRGSYCRVTVVDPAGRQAWSNPLWP